MTDRSGARPRRRHTALGTRIAATGIGLTGLLGLTATFTNGAAAQPDAEAAATSNTRTVDTATPAAPSTTSPSAADLVPTPSTTTPVEVRRTVPSSRAATPAPVARSGGSN
ncbi:MAG: hypothetical protein H6517_00140 [Microthrixaceae bacterium]|nr:hypothetical protein [Microthrixaceae bacterium]MCB1012431.1 hypothetical protein [Microthrixaceae bacterium]MCB9386215.1 hypothetical protein [Microthrixaceae bacterium]MCO5322069.1 hypothetical protein [Microthrixaceae bacterium]